MRKTDESLLGLPKPPSEDGLTEILNVIGEFSRDVAKHAEGIPNKDGLLQAVRPAHEKFRVTIRRTAPDFRSSTRDQGKGPLLSPTFLDDEDCSEPIEHESISDDGPTLTGESVFVNEPIFVDEVMQRAQEYAFFSHSNVQGF